MTNIQGMGGGWLLSEKMRREGEKACKIFISESRRLPWKHYFNEVKNMSTKRTDKGRRVEKAAARCKEPFKERSFENKRERNKIIQGRGGHAAQRRSEMEGLKKLLHRPRVHRGSRRLKAQAIRLRVLL